MHRTSLRKLLILISFCCFITATSVTSHAACEGGEGHSTQLLLTYPDIILAKVAKSVPGLQTELQVVRTFRGSSSGTLVWKLDPSMEADDFDQKALELRKSYLIGSDFPNKNSFIQLSICDFILEEKDAKTLIESLKKPLPPIPSATEIRQIRKQTIEDALKEEAKKRANKSPIPK